jgi:chromosome segregation ATPase
MESSPVPTPGSDAWVEQMAASLHAERSTVREFLGVQQARLERAEGTLEGLIARFEEIVENGTGEAGEHADADEDDQDYRQRYEMSLDDLRELKASNALLHDQLTKARSAASSLGKQNQASSGGLDWESQKLRILAALESDLDENDSEQRGERLKIEDVLRTTENAIAEKDREIRELKRQLQESSGVGNLVQAAAAVEQVLQSDTAIQDERERLRQMEEQLQNRLCQAEIEISLERAKLARERAELDDRLRKAGLEGAKSDTEPGAAAPAQPTRGRWMSRLGLTDADRERGRRR